MSRALILGSVLCGFCKGLAFNLSANASTEQICTVYFDHRDCAGPNDRRKEKSFLANFENHNGILQPVHFTIYYSQKGGENTEGCSGTYQRSDMLFTDNLGLPRIVNLVNEYNGHAHEVSNFDFGQCPFVEGDIEHDCEIEYFVKDCSEWHHGFKRKAFKAAVGSEPLDYKIKYSNKGGNSSADCNGETYLDSDLVFTDIYGNEQTVELERQEQNAHQVQSVRFSAGCNFNTEFGCQCD